MRAFANPSIEGEVAPEAAAPEVNLAVDLHT
jgi:hypothetical protein